MITLTFTDVHYPENRLNKYYRRCTIERDGVVIGRISSRKPEFLPSVVQRTLRTMGITGQPEYQSDDVWVIR